MKRSTATYAFRLLALVAGILIVEAGQSATIQPTTHAGEVDLAVIMAPYESAGWVRIPDAIDQVFEVPGYQPQYIVAWEDLIDGDFDYNDRVLLCSFGGGCSSIAAYSSAAHTWGVDGSAPSWTVWLDGRPYAGSALFSTDQSLNASSGFGDYAAVWGKPIMATPEPSSWLLLGAGALAIMWRRRFMNRVVRGGAGGQS